MNTNARDLDESYLHDRGFAVKLENSVTPVGSLRIGELNRGYSLILHEEEWLRHMAIFGPPGSGKSKTFLKNMLRDMACGGSAIVLDPKGELFEQTANSFREVYRLDLVNPSRSDRWNFLPKCKDHPEFAAEMARIILENSIEPYLEAQWYKYEFLLLKAVLLHLADIAEATPSMISAYLDMESDHSLARDMKEIEFEMLSSGNEHVRLAWEAFARAVPELRGAVATALIERLDVFRGDCAKKVCDPVTDEERAIRVFRNERVARQIEFGRLRGRGTAIYVVIGDGDELRYRSLVAAFLSHALHELRIETTSENLSPVGFVFDEDAYERIVGLKEMLAPTRGHKIGLILSYRSISQVHDGYGQGREAMLRSIGTMMFLPGLDEMTCEYASGRTSEVVRDAMMQPSEVWEMRKDHECLVAVDLLLPIKARYLPFGAACSRKGILVELGQKFLRSLGALDRRQRVKSLT
jgi:type IV secretion system protein VirD4